WVTALLILASVGTVLAVAVKLPYYTFFGPNAPSTPPGAVPGGMIVAMAAGTVLSLWVGLHPSSLFDVLRLELEPGSFDTAEVLTGIGVLAASALIGWLLLGAMRPRDNVIVDTDWSYRNAERPVRLLVQQPLEFIFTTAERVTSAVTGLVTRFVLDPPPKGANLVRPPLGVAVAAIFLTFAVVVLLAELL
ncbi:MAG: hypothetical protein V3S98_08915, partial [Dehalococcoidia bacterium]